jgi:hypothetical protein
MTKLVVAGSIEAGIREALRTLGEQRAVEAVESFGGSANPHLFCGNWAIRTTRAITSN